MSLLEDLVGAIAGKMMAGDTCEWTEGATKGVWKSTCSLVPFLGYQPQTKECPYCDRPVNVTAVDTEGNQT